MAQYSVTLFFEEEELEELVWLLAREEEELPAAVVELLEHIFMWKEER